MTKAVVEHMYEKHYLSDYLEVESQSATNVTIQSLGLGVFEDTFENAQWRKVKQMQSLRQRIFLCRCCEQPFKNTRWKKPNECMHGGLFLWVPQGFLWVFLWLFLWVCMHV